MDVDDAGEGGGDEDGSMERLVVEGGGDATGGAGGGAGGGANEVTEQGAEVVEASERCESDASGEREARDADVEAELGEDEAEEMEGEEGEEAGEKLGEEDDEDVSEEEEEEGDEAAGGGGAEGGDDAYAAPEAGDLASYLAHVSSLPAADPVALFGMGENASLTCALSEVSALLRAIVDIQPRLGAGAESSDADATSALAARLASELPEPLTAVEGAASGSLGATAMPARRRRYQWSCSTRWSDTTRCCPS